MSNIGRSFVYFTCIIIIVLFNVKNGFIDVA